MVPSGTFATNDGRYVVIGGNGDSVYTRLMTAIGRSDMTADNPQYASNAARVEREDEIMGVIEAWAKQHSLEEVMNIMKEARVPAGEEGGGRGGGGSMEECGDGGGHGGVWGWGVGGRGEGEGMEKYGDQGRGERGGMEESGDGVRE